MKNKKILSLSLLSFIVLLIMSSCGKKIENKEQPMENKEQHLESKEQNLNIEKKVNELMAKMTLQEKLGQLMQYTGAGELTGALEGSYSRVDKVKEGMVGSMLNVNGAEYTRKLQEIAVNETRLGIPLIFGYDVIHGYKTIFPIPLGEAASWNLKSMEKSAHIAAEEAASAGQHWTFAPMVDIARDARWGRVMEGAGEDTYYGSLVAAARVRGFQGSDLSQNNTILACAKHFAAYGAAIAGRDYYSTEVSKRTLQQVYLPPFKAALDAGVETFMSGFNDLNGIPATGNKYLLTDVLQKQWNFKGFVVSDWASVQQLTVHKFAKDLKQASEIAFNAGVHMDMEGNAYAENLGELLDENKVSQAQIDDAVRRILTAKFKLGLFDDPYRYCDLEHEKNTLLKKENLDFARKSARESFVLLKNEEQTFPIKKSVKTIALIGPLADNKKDMIGTWSARGEAKDVVSVLEGLKKRAAEDVKIIYVKGCNINDDKANKFDKALDAAKKADLVLLAMGEEAMMSGEALSRMDIRIPQVQRELMKYLKKANKPMALLLFNGRPISLAWESENLSAILELWLPGTMAGDAVADVVFGDYNPSGKLPISFPYSVGQCPIFYNYKNTGKPMTQERYTSKYIDGPNMPLYPFGFGLSYTNFDYSNLTIDKKSMRMQDTLLISVLVKNTGKRAGIEIVHLYINDLVASVTPVVHQLRGFDNIKLAPGEEKLVKFRISAKDLAFVGQDLNWVTEAGDFEIEIKDLKTRFELVE